MGIGSHIGDAEHKPAQNVDYDDSLQIFRMINVRRKPDQKLR
jgi:hypothetical protein